MCIMREVNHTNTKIHIKLKTHVFVDVLQWVERKFT